MSFQIDLSINALNGLERLQKNTVWFMKSVKKRKPLLSFKLSDTIWTSDL
jgi:hypothetical protein